MPAKILDGRQLAQGIRAQLQAEVQALAARTGQVPHFVNVLIGEDHGACAYANSQKRVAEQIGIRYDLTTLSSEIRQPELVEQIGRLNADPDVHGVMIHQPVPAHIDYQSVANGLAMAKDLEGINVANVGKMLLGQTRMIPCTPAAVMEHLRSTGMDLRGREAVVVGASHIVGQPLALLLTREMATVTLCHIATSEAGRLAEHVGRADILVVAVGKAGLIPGDWVKPGAVVVDVGINRVGDQIVGDVDFDSARERASYITPVPGGVGPVTVMMLMRNGLQAFKMQLEGCGAAEGRSRG